MIRVLWFIVILAIVATGAAWLADRPGDVAVVWQGYRIETTVTVTVLAVLAAVVVAVVAWGVLRLVLRTPDVVSMATRGRRRSRGFTALSRGMVAVGSGDPVLARRYAQEAEKLLGREPMTLLLRAQAAQLAGDRKVAEAAFNAMLAQPETRILGLRGLYVEARRKGDLAAAYTLAGRAAHIDPAVGWANEAVLEHLGAQRRWGEALSMLERRLAAGRMDRELARRQRAVLLTADAIDRADADPDEALGAVRQAVKLAPDLIPAVALQGRLLSRQGALRKATRALEAGWKLSPHPDIAAAYIDMRSGDSALDRLDRARNLQRLTPGHEEARIIVARAAIDAREYDRAAAALEPLLRNRPAARVCLMMAEIAENGPAAAGQVREWLARASRAPRDPSWIADGVVSDHWQPMSPVTGKLDAFVWAAPTELLGAHPAAFAAEDVIADGDEALSAGFLAAPVNRAAQPDIVASAATKAARATKETLSAQPASAPANNRGAVSGSPPPTQGAAPVVVAGKGAVAEAAGDKRAGQIDAVVPAGAGISGAGKPIAESSPATSPASTVVGPRAGTGSDAMSPADGAAGDVKPRAPAMRPPPRSEVIFPIARAPDDPGPGADMADNEPVQTRRIDL